MRCCWVVALFVVACGGSSPVPADPPAAAVARGRVETRVFRSAALGVDKRFHVHLPASYDARPDRRYPTIFQLHGLTGDEDSWLALGLPEAADAIGLEAIVVLPDGDDGFWADRATPTDAAACRASGSPLLPGVDPASYCVETAAYATYVTHDLVAEIDARYRTLATAAGRAVGGLSMGGFGALHLALRNPAVFTVAVSHSGIAALRYVGPHPYGGDPAAAVLHDDPTTWGAQLEPIGAMVRGIFGADPQRWLAHDPVALIDARPAPAPALYLDCGTEDHFGLHDQAAYLHDLLEARGIAHAFYLGPGGHDPGFWRDRVDDGLRFAAAHLAPAAP